MIAARLPHNETERLEALFRAAILDTDAEDFFEDVVDSVQAMVPVPIVLISLVDEWRQWFKARRGLEASETPRDYAFCAHTILSDLPMVIQDSTKDARFFDNPFVTAHPHVIAYAGAPITLACGARLGTVCAIDTKARAWTQVEVSQIERSARMVGRHIDSRRAVLEKDRQKFLDLALSRAETRYKSVLESMSEGMVVQGPSGAIIDFNPAACEILGLTPDELFGRTSPDPRWRAIRPNGEAFCGEDHPSMVTLRTGEPQHGVIMGVVTPENERRWLRINSYPVRRADGRVDQVVAVFHRIAGAPGLGALDDPHIG